MRAPAAVTLYERPGCHLCEETLEALGRIAGARRLEIARVDITTDPELERRYVLRIPVLRAGERELDAAGLDDAAIGAWLATLDRGN